MFSAAEGPPDVSEPTGMLTMSDGARIAYRTRGTGPALIMVHGWSQSGAMFQHQLDCLSRDFTVVVPDVRGHGESPDTASGLRMARLAADLRETVDQLGIDRFSLLGWSMGVSVLWSFVDLFGTARVERFIFVDQPAMLTALPGMTEVEAAHCGALFTLESLGELCAALRSPEAETVRASFVGSMVTANIAPALFDWILAENGKTSATLAASLLLSHSTNDWRDVLARIDRPTLVIGGSASHVATCSQRHVHAQIAGSTYREFTAEEGGAHFPFLEASDLFNEIVGDFLRV